MPTVSATSIWTLYLIVLVDMVNFGMVFPLLPSIAERFGKDAAAVGSLATAFSVAQVISNPMLGKASDRWGRRSVLLVAVLGRTLSTAMIGFAWSFPMVIVARAMGGACGGTAGIVNAFMADITTIKERPVFMSKLQASSSMGLIMGPAIGGALSHSGFYVACYASSAISGVNLLVMALFLADPTHCRSQARDATVSRADDGRPSGGETTSMPEPQQDHIPRSAGLLFGAAFLSTLGLAAFESITSYYLMDTYYHGDRIATGQFCGQLFAIAGATMFVMAVFIYKPMLKICGEKLAVIAGGMLGSLGFLGMSWAPTPWWFALMAVLQVAGSSLLSPTSASLLTIICSEKTCGTALGYQQAFRAVARTFAPLAFAHLYNHYDKRIGFWVNAVSSILVVPMILAVSCRRAVAAGPALDIEQGEVSGDGSPKPDPSLPGEAVEAAADAADRAAANSDAEGEVVEALEVSRDLDLEEGEVAEEPDETSAPALEPGEVEGAVQSECGWLCF